MRARLLVVALLAVTLGWAALSCDSDSDAKGAGGYETVVVPGGKSTEAPPPTTVSSGGQTVEMGIGTYCWTTMCVDKIGPITKGTLEVSRRDRVVVVIPPASTRLLDVSVEAIAANGPQTLANGETAWRPNFEGAINLPATHTSQAVEFAAELSPGSYVVSVRMRFEQGDVSYSVVLDVK